DPGFAGLHFTGSSATFKQLWRTIADNIDEYGCYPRIVGETGGKDFIVAHASARTDKLVPALVRGAFEYQGQKCSAASRAYIPRSLWDGGVREQLAALTDSVSFGDVTDLSFFGGAVIDEKAYTKHKQLLDRIADDPAVTVLTGGHCDDSVGYFVAPTVLVCDDPGHEVFTDEYFGPIIAVHPYDDGQYGRTLEHLDNAAPYGLTGAVFAD